MLLYLVTCQLDQLNQESRFEVSADWEMPPEVELSAGPSTFHYDSTHGKLIHLGAISAERRLQLRELLTWGAAQSNAGAEKKKVKDEDTEHRQPDEGKGATVSAPAAPEVVSKNAKAQRSYYDAIDSLVSLASARDGAIVQLLLVLGGLGGALGAILRSLVDFVGNACYKRQLDLTRWWPLYLTRPVVGGLLGFILVVMFKARLFSVSGAVTEDGSLWWLGVAVLGGFSTIDVTQRLRLAAKALFGVHSGKDS